ncbi:hypothetical protein [Treponema denticola]|nr:hypothetical protein [Treponema denticola]
MIQHGILLEKNLSFSSKTTRQNKKNMYTIPPPPNFLQINGYLRCRLTKNSPRHIKSGTDAADSKLQQVFRQKNLSLDSVHGRTLSNMPAGVFCTLLASTPPICKKAGYIWQTVNLPRLFHKRIVTKKQTEKLFSKIISDIEPEVLNNNKFVQQIKTTNLQLINIQGGIFINRHECRRFQACKSFANAKL